jgi:hypothetical protein
MFRKYDVTVLALKSELCRAEFMTNARHGLKVFRKILSTIQTSSYLK